MPATLPAHNSPRHIPRLGFGLVAIRESKVPSSELFVALEILYAGVDVDITYKIIKEGVQRLTGENEYMDLFSIHSPNGGKENRRLIWEVNYGIQHIEEMRAFATTWLPVVNQIKVLTPIHMHPWCQQRGIVEYCKTNDITIEAYCPDAPSKKAHDKTLQCVAEKHTRTPSQVLVRWSLHKGYVSLPKSDDAIEVVTNAQVFDFNLDEEDMAVLDSLDQGNKGAMVRAVEN
ncbi:Aldo/keto reductase [Amniculicola lignicola CBS 123094]|uniref:Aldo/keto reductase n=1 Tax=Amniculicola lignicola CBS 123094 TaxID=1392246 RepID=A0A6A5WFN3_9PLEO|nr:Aldo/keto reductase [Amniculicola lignicola CBS 123094]